VEAVCSVTTYCKDLFGDYCNKYFVRTQVRITVEPGSQRERGLVGLIEGFGFSARITFLGLPFYFEFY
jgi:hypothetical protein